MAEPMVRVVNRSKTGPVEWMYDSEVYALAAHGAKDKNGKPADRRIVHREAAFLGVKRLPIKQDRYTGLTIESFLGIEELDGEPSEFPCDPIDLHPRDLVDTDKTGTPVIRTVTDKETGQPVPVKQRVDKIVGLSG